MLLDGKDAIIALTLRHDRLDNFWFVLFHELGHIVRHRNRGLEDGFFDEESAAAKIAVEEEADDFARKALIDRKSVVQGKSVYVRVDLGGRRLIKRKKKAKRNRC